MVGSATDTKRLRMPARILSFLIFFLLALPEMLVARGIPVILSTDVGNEIDDQWAITYLLLSSEFDVRGIISAHAPTIAAPAGQTSYEILRDVVEHRLGMVSHPPLYAGADGPLQDMTAPLESEGVDFIIEASREFDSGRRLDVLTIGATTDVASAILKDPGIVSRIRLIDMGFKAWAGEGQGKEFNIQNDPKAMQVILNSRVPLVVGSAAVCKASLALSLDQAREMMEDRGPVGEWLWTEFAAWYYRHVKPLRKDNFSKPWIIWDNIVLAYLLGMTSQEEYLRPRLTQGLSFDKVETQETITWITDVDEKRMWADFLEKLDDYQRRHFVGHRIP